MSKPLTQGEKNRRANIRSLKALGARNAKLRAAAKVERFLAHVECNNKAAERAARHRAARIERHEEDNRFRAQAARWERAARKAAEAGEPVGPPPAVVYLANNDTMGAVLTALFGADGDLPLAA